MNNTVSKRLQRLEQTETRGIKVFTKLEDGRYLAWNKNAPEGSDQTICERADLDQYAREGWQNIVVQYVQRSESEANDG